MRRNVAWLIAALTMASGGAWAQNSGPGATPAAGSPHGHGGEHAGGNEHGNEHGNGSGAGNGSGSGHGRGHGEDSDDDDDAAAAPAIARTPAQAAKRQAIVSERRAAIETAVHKNGKTLTPAERQAIGVHWRHVMRLLRIREIAEEAKDTATVTRVDALLDRASKHFEAKIAKLNDEAPPSAAGGAK